MGGLNYLIHNNKLYNNTIGIWARASNSTFSNNFVQDFNEYGFYFVESNYNIISNNSIQKLGKYEEIYLKRYNHILGKYGIYLQNSNYNTITGNYITCQVSCIKEVNCYENIFSNNICRKIPEPELMFRYYPWLMLGILIIIICIIPGYLKKKMNR